MEFMNDDTSEMSSEMERVRKERYIDTSYHSQHVRISKEKNVLYFEDTSHLILSL